MRSKWFKFPLFLVFAALAMLVFGGATAWLWNTLVPELFHGPLLTYWQAVGLLVLLRILFGGFGRGHHRCGSHRGGHWRKEWMYNMGKMTPEEREKMREEWRKKCAGEWLEPEKTD